MLSTTNERQNRDLLQTTKSYSTTYTAINTQMDRVPFAMVRPHSTSFENIQHGMKNQFTFDIMHRYVAYFIEYATHRYPDHNIAVPKNAHIRVDSRRRRHLRLLPTQTVVISKSLAWCIVLSGPEHCTMASVG